MIVFVPNSTPIVGLRVAWNDGATVSDLDGAPEEPEPEPAVAAAVDGEDELEPFMPFPEVVEPSEEDCKK